MAKKTIIEYVDDLDGKKVELDDLVIKEFTVDGIVYRLEVRVSNAEKFDAQLAKWVGAATRVGGRKNTRAKIVGGGSPDQTKAIREWANANGYAVSSRGRISADIVEAFEAAH